jgi:hypothetical protein
MKIRCLHCDTVMVHDKRNVAGCNCDPDAPQWVCIQPNGKVFGLSNAKWEELQ